MTRGKKAAAPTIVADKHEPHPISYVEVHGPDRNRNTVTLPDQTKPAHDVNHGQVATAPAADDGATYQVWVRRRDVEGDQWRAIGWSTFGLAPDGRDVIRFPRSFRDLAAAEQARADAAQAGLEARIM